MLNHNGYIEVGPLVSFYCWQAIFKVRCRQSDVKLDYYCDTTFGLLCVKNTPAPASGHLVTWPTQKLLLLQNRHNHAAFFPPGPDLITIMPPRYYPVWLICPITPLPCYSVLPSRPTCSCSGHVTRRYSAVRRDVHPHSHCRVTLRCEQSSFSTTQQQRPLFFSRVTNADLSSSRSKVFFPFSYSIFTSRLRGQNRKMLSWKRKKGI